MLEYHKIETVWKRDPKTRYKTLIEGEWAHPAFHLLSGLTWHCSEKVDGTNIRILWEGPGSPARFRGKTDDAQIHAGLIEVLREWFTDEKFSKVFTDGPVCLYGEGYGKKIQGGGNYKPDGQSFVLFDVLVGSIWLERENVEDVAVNMIPTDIRVVPSSGFYTLHEAIDIVGGNGKLRSAWGDFDAEGFVLRPQVELFDRIGRRIITKIKRKDFAR